MTIKKYRAPKCFEEKAEQYGYKYDLKDVEWMMKLMPLDMHICRLI